MSITVEWDNEAKTAIRFDIHAGSGWEAFDRAVALGNQMMTGVEHVVDVIINPDEEAPPPPGAMARFKQAQASSPYNRGLIVIVGANLLARLLVTTFSRIYPSLGEEVRFASSLEDARDILARRQRASV